MTSTRSRGRLAAYLAAALALALAVRLVLDVAGGYVLVVVVEGSSMLPTLRTGDIVFTVKLPPDEIRPGDIIVFEAVSDRHLVIHRVVKVNVVGGTYYYVTKGDNNLLPDNLVPRIEYSVGIPYDMVKGSVVGIWVDGSKYPFKIPLLGYVSIAVAELKKVLGDVLNP